MNRRSFMRAALLSAAEATAIVALPPSVSYFFMGGGGRLLSTNDVRALEVDTLEYLWANFKIMPDALYATAESVRELRKITGMRGLDIMIYETEEAT